MGSHEALDPGMVAATEVGTEKHRTRTRVWTAPLQCPGPDGARGTRRGKTGHGDRATTGTDPRNMQRKQEHAREEVAKVQSLTEECDPTLEKTK